MSFNIGAGPVTGANVGTVDNIVLTLPATVAGRQIIVGVIWTSVAVSITSITCSGESPLTVHGSPASNATIARRCQLASLANITSGGTKTITVTLNSTFGSNGFSAFAFEVAGGNTASFFDASAIATGNNVADPTVAVTTANPGSLLVSLVVSANAETVPGGHIEITMSDVTGASGPVTSAAYNLDAGAAGSKSIVYTSGGTPANDDWAIFAAAFNVGPEPPYSGIWTLPSITMDATLELGPDQWAGTWDIPIFTFDGTLATGFMMTGDATLPTPTMSSSFNEIGELTGEWEILLFTMEGDVISGFFGESTLPLPQFSGSFHGSNEYDAQWRIPAPQFEGTLLNGNTYSGVWTLPSIEFEGINQLYDLTAVWTMPMPIMSGRFESATAATYRGWPVNLKNAALTEYDNYAFNSFARYNGEYLGAGAAGIAALTGADDAGTNITSRVRFALSNLGSEQLKRVSDVFVSYRSDGLLLLRVVVDGGQTYEYRLPATGNTGIHTNRAKVGKGIKLTYWCFEIENFDGNAFDLDAIRLKPVMLSRRTGG